MIDIMANNRIYHIMDEWWRPSFSIFCLGANILCTVSFVGVCPGEKPDRMATISSERRRSAQKTREVYLNHMGSKSVATRKAAMQDVLPQSRKGA